MYYSCVYVYNRKWWILKSTGSVKFISVSMKSSLFYVFFLIWEKYEILDFTRRDVYLSSVITIFTPQVLNCSLIQDMDLIIWELVTCNHDIQTS